VDNTILNVALPTLVRTLHATSSQLQWIVDSYAMVFAGLLLVGGSLADRLGRKRFFLLGLAVFASGSVGAAFSGSVDLLIAWRAVMGAGAALTIPASLSIINDMFRDPAERARAIAGWAATIGLGIAIGPIAGGLLLARFWWGSIFLVNIPIVAAACAGALLLVPGSKNPAADPPDPAGALLSIAGLGLLLWAIIEAPAHGWTAGQVVGAGLASLAVLGAFTAWEARCSHPMLKLGFFRDRRFSIAAAAECLGIFGLLGALFLQTQVLQFDLGYSPLQAGLRILPVAAVLCVSAPLSPIAARVIGLKFTAAAGLAAIAAGLGANSAISTAVATYPDFIPGMLLIGLGAGLLLPTATNSVIGSVPRGDSGIGSATNSVALQVGGALGVAVIGSVLSTRYQNHMTAALAGQHVPIAATHAILGSLGGALAVASAAGGVTGALLAHAARAAFMSGNGAALAAGAVAAAAGVLLVLIRLPSRASRQEAGPAPTRSNTPAGGSPQSGGFAHGAGCRWVRWPSWSRMHRISAGRPWAPMAWGIMVENSAAWPASTRMVRSPSSSTTVPDRTVNQSRPGWTPSASVPGRGPGLVSDQPMLVQCASRARRGSSQQAANATTIMMRVTSRVRSAASRPRPAAIAACGPPFSSEIVLKNSVARTATPSEAPSCWDDSSRPDAEPTS
jgi:EmrB/QacA subfamily drug resistance transporter